MSASAPPFLAPAGEPWSSERVNASMAFQAASAQDRAATNCWSAIRRVGGKTVVYLKDTNRPYYANRLLDGTAQFEYGLPSKPVVHEQQVIALLREGAANFEAGRHAALQEVWLFAVAHARDHFLGQFVVVRFAPDALVEKRQRPRGTLHRLRDQTPEVTRQVVRPAAPKRSRSEAMHLPVLERLCPGWHIAHEPMCACNLDAPLVSEGARNACAPDEYTVDYIACKGDRRVCFESKCCLADAHAPAAVAKCRLLRDRTLTRVVTIAGHDEELRLVDFGDPADPREDVLTLEEAHRRFAAGD